MSNQKNQLNIVLLIVLLGFIGNSIAYPIFAPLFLHPAHGDIVPNTLSVRFRSISLGITLMMYPLGQFIGTPILGALSDRHGRKNILLFSMGMITIFYLLTAIALRFRILTLLIMSRFLSGCFEGNIAIARAIVVDDETLDKHKSLGLINAMSALGYIIGPLIGGALADKHLLSWFNFALPFYFAALLSLLLMLLTAIYIRESLKQPNISDITLLQQFNIFSRLKRLCQNNLLKILFISSLLASLAYDTFYEFYPAYMTGLWHASSLIIAIYTAILSAAIAIGCGLCHLLARYFSTPRLIVTGMPIIVTALLILLMIPAKTVVFIVFIIIGFAIAITTTSTTVQISESTHANRQGEVFGVLWGMRMLLDGLSAVIGAFLIIVGYSLPMASAALCAFAAWLVYYRLIFKKLPS